MNAKIERGLFWFRHDLRLTDMPALTELSEQVDELLLLYIFDERLLTENFAGVPSLGAYRKQFINQCLAELNKKLEALGQHLVVVTGNPVDVLNGMISSHNIRKIASHFHGGYYEVNDWSTLGHVHPHLTFIQRHACSLFDELSLPFDVKDMPTQFTPFRKQIEKHIEPPPPIDSITALPPAIAMIVNTTQDLTSADGLFSGGEDAGKTRVYDYFFNRHHVTTYKQTRNALDDDTASTRFSPWLASGALSPRWVYQQLKRYEQEHTANDSTYWVYFELLWREFFFWAQTKHGAHWFRQAGLRGEARDCRHDEEKIHAWQKGDTGYAVVDACMRQLRQTGFMSNRGRQLVASCFVHELEQNWQYGAAWFEHQLVDYDVGSNWGNWLYLAGVGHDPRGHRQFDLQKQGDRYDPDGAFLRRWLK